MIINQPKISVFQPKTIEKYLYNYSVNEAISTEDVIFLVRNDAKEPTPKEIGRMLLVQGECRLEKIKTVFYIKNEQYQWFEELNLHRIMFIEVE